MNRLLGAGRPLVLQRFEVNAQTGHVTIVGRKPGLIGFFLTAMGLDASTLLQASPHEIRVRRASVFGETLDVFPSPNIASASCGYLKPFQLLISAAIMVLLIPFMAVQQAPVPAAVNGVLLVLALIFVVAYFLSKTLYIAVQTSGTGGAVIAFKRSLIENVQVDIEQAREVISVISDNIVRTQTHGIPATLQSPSQPALGQLGGSAADRTDGSSGPKPRV